MDQKNLMENALATIQPSLPRRMVSFVIILSLGGILVYIALATPPASLFWRFFLLALGIGALVLADKLRRATQQTIIMTDQELFESSGREICSLQDIAGIDRGTFAFKPSNGFLIRTKKPGPRSWAPGLWWRVGRKIGVGGVTGAGEAKFMSELIALRLPDDA